MVDEDGEWASRNETGFCPDLCVDVRDKEGLESERRREDWLERFAFARVVQERKCDLGMLVPCMRMLVKERNA